MALWFTRAPGVTGWFRHRGGCQEPCSRSRYHAGPRAYPETVLIGLLVVLLDLAAVAGLITASVVAAVRLRPSRPARPRAATFRRWTTLITLLAALGLLVLGNVRFLVSSYDQGRPASPPPGCQRTRTTRQATARRTQPVDTEHGRSAGGMAPGICSSPSVVAPSSGLMRGTGPHRARHRPPCSPTSSPGTTQSTSGSSTGGDDPSRAWKQALSGPQATSTG